MPRGSRENGTRRRPLLAAAASLLVAGLVSTGPASAHTFTKTDGNDSPGRLDIRTASVGHGNSKVVHTVRTFEGWTPKSLGNDSFFVVEIDKNFDNDFEQCAFIFFAGGRLRGYLTNCRQTFIRQLPVSKPSKAAAKITIPTANTGTAYRWVVFSFWTGPPARCSDLCFDAAPNRPPPILHDLIPPNVTLPSTDPIRVWEETDGTDVSFQFSFTLVDPGGSSGSGMATWKIQQRPIGSTSWTDTGVSGSGRGAKTPTLSGTEGSAIDYRVVAVDRQANQTNGPARRVYIPTDDDGLDPDAFSDTPAEISDVTAFGGGLSQMSTGTLTHTWTPGDDCRFELIGPGSGDWWVRVLVDGTTTHDLTDEDFPDSPRLTLFSHPGSGGICATEYVVTVMSGTFALDAVLAASD
jgi:hypothetical protein